MNINKDLYHLHIFLRLQQLMDKLLHDFFYHRRQSCNTLMNWSSLFIQHPSNMNYKFYLNILSPLHSRIESLGDKLIDLLVPFLFFYLYLIQHNLSASHYSIISSHIHTLVLFLTCHMHISLSNQFYLILSLKNTLISQIPLHPPTYFQLPFSHSL